MLIEELRLENGSLLIGAEAGAWTDLRMVAAGGGALGVDGAATAGRGKEDAVVVGPSGQGKDLMLEVEMIDQAGFFQPFGKLFGRFLGFKSINKFHAYQILNAHFHRQTATDRSTVVAQPFAVFDPGRRTVDVGVVSDYLFHNCDAGGTAENLRREQLEGRLIQTGCAPESDDQRGGTLLEGAGNCKGKAKKSSRLSKIIGWTALKQPVVRGHQLDSAGKALWRCGSGTDPLGRP
jgi:hypothetical protein